MKELWNQIYHRKKERLGLSVIIFLILIVLAMRSYYLNYSEPDHNRYKDLISQVDFVSEDNNNKTLKQKKHKKSPTPTIRFSFDPNSLSEDSFSLLGLPKYVGANIEKYRAKGGKFRTPYDLKRIYGIEKYYNNISDLISIKKINAPIHIRKTVEKITEKTYLLKEPDSRRVIELNTADSIDLLELKGIGPFYAKTILEMRQKLGGFANAKQLTEAYGVPDTILQTIDPKWIKIDLTKIRKINLNTADFITLVKHPYLNKNQTNAILAYRRAHGGFKSAEDLKKIHLISNEDYAKLRWYLEV